jgi:hypothetical protein
VGIFFTIPPIWLSGRSGICIILKLSKLLPNFGFSMGLFMIFKGELRHEY